MPLISPCVRHNYLAIAVAAVASFLLEIIWYSLFLKAWLRGLGHDMAWLEHTGVSLGVQCLTALLAAALIALCISSFMQLTGPQTAVRGIKIGSGLWLGCVLTTFATESVFELRGYQLFAINLGFWLLTMVLMGAIVGGWKKAGNSD